MQTSPQQQPLNFSGEDRYLQRFEAEFLKIMDEISMYSSVLPQYKTENESLRERITNIRGWAEAASKIRYMPDTDLDAVMANLITQILAETDKIDELKPIVQKEPDIKAVSDELFQMLGSGKSIALDEAFRGFDFFDNNPYKKSAEKKLEKIKKKAKK